MKTRRIILSFLLFFLAGCSTPTITQPTSIPSYPPLEMESTTTVIPSLPAVNASPTTVLSSTPTQTLTPSPFPTQTIPPALQTSCLDPIDKEQAPALPEGVVLFSDYSNEHHSLIDLQTGTIIPIQTNGGQYIESLAVSKNHQKLAYLEVNSEMGYSNLVIMDAAGQKRKEIKLEAAIGNIETWLDGESLLVDKDAGEFRYSVVLINTTTGEKRDLSADYPDINVVPPRPQWSQYTLSETVYDPMLTRVIYPSMKNDGSGVVLWDDAKEKKIVEVDTVGFGSMPVWNRDGSWFLLKNSISGIEYDTYPSTRDDEIFAISREGTQTRLTYLSENYSSVHLGSMSLSDNNQKIAFWTMIEPVEYSDQYGDLSQDKHVQRLAVYDSAIKTVTDLCLPGDLYNGNAASPVWSPDGRWLVVDQQQDMLHGKTYLVDLTNGLVIPIGDDLVPLGWLYAP